MTLSLSEIIETIGSQSLLVSALDEFTLSDSKKLKHVDLESFPVLVGQALSNCEISADKLREFKDSLEEARAATRLLEDGVEQLAAKVNEAHDLAEDLLNLASKMPVNSTIFDTVPELVMQSLEKCQAGILANQDISESLEVVRQLLDSQSPSSGLGVSSDSVAIGTIDIAFTSIDQFSSEIIPEEIANFETDLSNTVDQLHQLQKSVSQSGSKTIAGFMMITSMLGAVLNHPVTKTVVDLSKQSFAAVGVYGTVQQSKNPGTLEFKDALDQYLKMAEADIKRQRQRNEEELEAGAGARMERDRTPGASS